MGRSGQGMPLDWLLLLLLLLIPLQVPPCQHWCCWVLTVTGQLLLARLPKVLLASLGAEGTAIWSFAGQGPLICPVYKYVALLTHYC